MGFFERIMRYANEYKQEAGIPDKKVEEAAAQSPCERALLAELAELVDMGLDQAVVRYALHFSGEVQFVGFRWTNKELAEDRGLTGWVRNEDDGTVTMEIQGRPAAIGAHFGMLHAYYSKYGNRIWLETAEVVTPVEGETEFAIRDLY